MRYIRTFENYNGSGIASLKNFLEAMSGFGSGMQKRIAQAKLSAIKPVKCVRVADAAGLDAVDDVKKYVRPKKKNCYANALHAAQHIQGDVKYCEGWIIVGGLPIDHAFNKCGDMYFDVTEEFALGENPENQEYAVVGEWDYSTALKIMASGEYQCYGNVFEKEFISEHPENIE